MESRNGKLILTPIQKVFLNTEERIIDLIANKRNLGIAYYKERQLLENIQDILNDMYNKTYSLTPNYIESVFRKSKLDKIMRMANLSMEEKQIIERITDNFMNNILGCGNNIYNYLKNIIVDTKKEVNKVELNINRQDDLFKQLYRGQIQKRGLIGFTDKSGKNWTMQSYSDMLLRTTTRMAHNYGILYTFEHIDLYKISEHKTTCKLCAPYEGRVYSRSGTHPIYPPLASAFGKINKNGPNTLSNSYLNIHPNCLHTLIPFKEEGKSKEQIEAIRNKSNFETNPPNYNKQSESEINRYRNKENGRAKLNEAFKEYQKLRLTNYSKTPKTFQTFLNHKLKNDDIYKSYYK